MSTVAGPSTSADVNPAPSSKPTSGPSAQDKIKMGLEHKDKGNVAFQKGEHREALRSYYQAVLYLSGLDRNAMGAAVGPASNFNTDGGEEEVLTEDKKQLSLVRSNMAACFLKMNNYPRAIECATQALSIDPNNVKANFRRCTALRQSGDLYKAKEELTKLVKRLPDNADFKRELQGVEAELSKKEKEDGMKLKGFLGKGFAKGAAADKGKEEKK